MSNISPLNNLNELRTAVSWMQEALNAYEDEIVNCKEIAVLAKRAQKRIESYKPSTFEKEHKEIVLDLCISLSTIDRAEGNFKTFYLSSLKEELERLLELLGVGQNE